MRPITSLIQNPPQMVNELILHNVGDWNRGLVRSIFIKFDADAILSIPVCTIPVDDFWAWSHDSKGIFTVRSAYRMLVTTKIWREAWLEGRGDSSSNAREREAWGRLWQLKVPSKIRVFLWRLARHSIPTTDVLHRRNMAAQSACPLCGCQDSWRHALFMCPMSSSVWALAPEDLVHHLVDRMEEHPKDWLFAMNGVLNRDMFAHVIVIMWAIWRARRKAIYEDIFQSPHSIHGFITSFLEDLRYINAGEPQQTGVKSQGQPNGRLRPRDA